LCMCVHVFVSVRAGADADTVRLITHTLAHARLHAHTHARTGTWDERQRSKRAPFMANMTF